MIEIKMVELTKHCTLSDTNSIQAFTLTFKTVLFTVYSIYLKVFLIILNWLELLNEINNNSLINE